MSRYCLLVIVCLLFSSSVFAQDGPGFTFDVQRPFLLGGPLTFADIDDFAYEGQFGISFIYYHSQKGHWYYGIKGSIHRYELLDLASFLVLSPKIGVSYQKYATPKVAFAHQVFVGYAHWRFKDNFWDLDRVVHGATIDLGERVIIDLNRTVSLLIGFDIELTQFFGDGWQFVDLNYSFNPNVGIGFKL